MIPNASDFYSTEHSMNQCCDDDAIDVDEWMQSPRLELHSFFVDSSLNGLE
jgi:hypothetical protein